MVPLLTIKVVDSFIFFKFTPSFPSSTNHHSFPSVLHVLSLFHTHCLGLWPRSPSLWFSSPSFLFGHAPPSPLLWSRPFCRSSCICTCRLLHFTLVLAFFMCLIHTYRLLPIYLFLSFISFVHFIPPLHADLVLPSSVVSIMPFLQPS